MKEIFKGKRIYFLSDSGVHHGFNVYDMRSFISRNDEKCYIFNKGLGGNRAAMVKYLYEDEIMAIKPDVVIISYGGNDVSGYLYDSEKPVTAEVLAEREFRDKEHLDNMKESVLRMKADGIIPVIASCPGFDEFIGEKEGIETLADNDEKAKHLNSNFYKRQTMRNLNEKLEIYSKELEKFAKENDVMFIDLFSVFKKANCENSGLRKEDGCHLTEDKGHPLLAKTILEFLGYENVPDTFEHDEKNDEIFEYEQFERSIQYFKHALMSPWLGFDTEEKRANRLEELKTRKEHWIKKSVDNYLNHNQEIEKIEQTLSQKVYDYINNK